MPTMVERKSIRSHRGSKRTNDDRIGTHHQGGFTNRHIDETENGVTADPAHRRKRRWEQGGTRQGRRGKTMISEKRGRQALRRQRGGWLGRGNMIPRAFGCIGKEGTSDGAQIWVTAHISDARNIRTNGHTRIHTGVSINLRGLDSIEHHNATAITMPAQPGPER